ncbi:MAG: permease [Desulfarculaceae bacterium]|nr:permease [Desulfarculaceae bacterium]MCF8074172.1 permease [Desulfarculaceae bacterium]MCF8102753.1 permease [Desulfarculaceae bacterium]MCF8116392.1 permease [Desulfarculaceae bacterium]
MNQPDQIELFFSLVLALFWEAAPFLLLGSLVGALVEAFLSPELLARRLPRSRLAQVGLGLGAGMLLPTCECGVVPVARRLLERGVPPSTALTYMLAGPVINPVVLISTYVAFQGRWSMILGRVVVVGLSAAAVGLWLGRRAGGGLLKPDKPLPVPLLSSPAEAACGCGHDHSPPGRTPWSILVRTGEEFSSMAVYLLAGAVAAAAVKAFLPLEILGAVRGDLLLSVGTMMALAVLLSVCSEADAFVAASFLGFPPASQLAFIALGPMVDLKLLAMWGGAFRKGAVLALALLPTLLVGALSLLWGWLCW